MLRTTSETEGGVGPVKSIYTPDPLLIFECSTAVVMVVVCSVARFNVSFGTVYLIFTKTRPCNIQQYFTAVKMFIFRKNFFIFFLFLLKTLIVGTR